MGKDRGVKCVYGCTNGGKNVGGKGGRELSAWALLGFVWCVR